MTIRNLCMAIYWFSIIVIMIDSDYLFGDYWSNLHSIFVEKDEQSSTSNQINQNIDSIGRHPNEQHNDAIYMKLGSNLKFDTSDVCKLNFCRRRGNLSRKQLLLLHDLLVFVFLPEGFLFHLNWRIKIFRIVEHYSVHIRFEESLSRKSFSSV